MILAACQCFAYTIGMKKSRENNIRAIRIRLNMTQKDFANFIGVQPNTASMYEMHTKNQRFPSVRTCKKIIALCAKYGFTVKMDYLRPQDYV